MDQKKENQYQPPQPVQSPTSDFHLPQPASQTEAEPHSINTSTLAFNQGSSSQGTTPPQQSPALPAEFMKHPSPALGSTPFNPASNPGVVFSAPQTSIKAHKSRAKLILTAFVVVILLAAGGASAYYYQQNNTKQKPATTETKNNSSAAAEQAITIPENWTSIDTNLGFSISAPIKWSAGFAATANINGMQSKSTSIGPSIGLDSSVQNIEQLPEGVLISAATQKYSVTPGQEGYIKKVTILSKEDAAVLEGFGVKKDDIKTTSFEKSINGKQWEIVQTEIPNQYSTTGHLWIDDHAITLTILGPDKTEVNKYTESYLYPMMASVSIN